MTHEHSFGRYGDPGPQDYGDDLAEWCPGCGRLRRDIEEEARAEQVERPDRTLARDSGAAFLLGEVPPDELGFADLLSIGEALIEHYPPDTIVCSHHPEADIGARTVAAIADLIASCRPLGSGQ